MLDDGEKSGYKLLKSILENLTNGVVVFDINRKVLFTNPAITRMTGLSQDSLNFDELVDLFDGSERDIMGEVEKMFKTGDVSKIGKVAVSSIFTYEVLITPVLKKGDKVESGAIVLHDVTEVNDVIKLQTDFMSTASHQLKTPLTAIEWVVDRFLKKEQVSEVGRGYMEDIKKSVKELSKLVNILLNVSRIDSGRVAVKPEKIELIQFLKDYFRECESIVVKKNLRLVFANHPESLEMITDHGALRNIIQSIVSNALEYTDNNGKVELTVESKDDKILITVEDSGIGIPKVDQKFIFEKFRRASNAEGAKAGGTGLGAYIAKEAAKLLGGDITFESEEGKGTKFFIELPIESKAKKGMKSFS